MAGSSSVATSPHDGGETRREAGSTRARVAGTARRGFLVCGRETIITCPSGRIPESKNRDTGLSTSSTNVVFMGLAVETPTPPDLTNRSLPSELEPSDVLDGTADLRREELEEVLPDGAWSEGTYGDETALEE